jgi:hypothetical protein
MTSIVVKTGRLTHSSKSDIGGGFVKVRLDCSASRAAADPAEPPKRAFRFAAWATGQPLRGPGIARHVTPFLVPRIEVL